MISYFNDDRDLRNINDDRIISELFQQKLLVFINKHYFNSNLF